MSFETWRAGDIDINQKNASILQEAIGSLGAFQDYRHVGNRSCGSKIQMYFFKASSDEMPSDGFSE